jgi:hypothetical protein
MHYSGTLADLCDVVKLSRDNDGGADRPYPSIIT